MYKVAIISLLFAAAAAHSTYQNLIPNGHTVPNPCGTGYWLAVGHFDPLHHTHDKNQFGLVSFFISYIIVWVLIRAVLVRFNCFIVKYQVIDHNNINLYKT